MSETRTAQPEGSHFIGGKYAEDKAGEAFDTLHPATGEAVAHIHAATDAIIDQAIAAAQQAQPVWAAMSGAERGRVLIKAAQIMRERNDEIARIETLDTGKAIQETLYVDAVSAADNLEYFGNLVSTLTNEQIPVDDTAFAYTLREPLGIVAAVGAWNYPIQTATWKAAPALAMGNAIIYKPSEETPLTALKLAECLRDAGAPDGIIGIVQGKGEVGAKLLNHPAVSKVSLTGSVPTGKRIMASAADSLKKVSLELGGKSPLIIFDDAHLENAVSGAIMANFYSTGQVCSNGTRVFVQSGIREAFTERLVERTKAISIGDPLDPDVQMGPMISAKQLEIVNGYIEKGQAEGATMLCGGETPKVEGFEGGNWVAPVVFFDVTDDMTIAREEIFGPVLSLLNFDDEADVLARANDTIFGLAAGVFTADIGRAHRVVRQLQAGTTYINNFNLTPVGVPFGGYKMSGIGRENAHHAIDNYSQIKSVYVELGDVEAPY
ncbi:betaine-aldehyde dehydrogenase [Ahrensia sp. R2A130]|uniref:betaine-aldehyde dehydrogenase n=1 Tax=Ahrensia sp. R2A130 TaxID=744979 RepID=UPI0001E09C02|nr:betaine-aldehyde dehydrogenase [Ahrensia sp. R2A130]EFL90033.1 betaine aldehyde dehydrogenase [Ahrensia sp. R2A130]